VAVIHDQPAMAAYLIEQGVDVTLTDKVRTFHPLYSSFLFTQLILIFTPYFVFRTDRLRRIWPIRWVALTSPHCSYRTVRVSSERPRPSLRTAAATAPVSPMAGRSGVACLAEVATRI
jgi:hypothetical protein